MSKPKERKTAIALRKKGLSYKEILSVIPAAKSTLSLWLSSVGLSKRQTQRLTRKRIEAALQGAIRKKELRVERTKKIKEEAAGEVAQIDARDLWLMGIMLYWAEGSKEKEHEIGKGITFTNSDPLMIKMFLKWLIEVIGVARQDVKFEIYIHESHRKRLASVKHFWVVTTEFPKSAFRSVYFKRQKIKTNRKNTGNSYHGVLRVGVRASSILQRRIAGWIVGICRHCGVV